MAIILKKAATQEDDGSKVYIEVLNATGVYDNPDNLGGFGTPNLERNTLALIFYGNNEQVAANVELVPETHNPLTVESFTILTADLDGVWHYYVWAIPIFDDQVAYNSGDIVYDNENPSLPFLKKYNGSTFDTVTAASLADETDLIEVEAYDFPIPETSDFISDLRKEQLSLLKRVREGTSEIDSWEEKHMQFVFARDETNTATNSFCAGFYTTAQESIEEVLKMKSEIS